MFCRKTHNWLFFTYCFRNSKGKITRICLQLLKENIKYILNFLRSSKIKNRVVYFLIPCYLSDTCLKRTPKAKLRFQIKKITSTNLHVPFQTANYFPYTICSPYEPPHRCHSYYHRWQYKTGTIKISMPFIIIDLLLYVTSYCREGYTVVLYSKPEPQIPFFPTHWRGQTNQRDSLSVNMKKIQREDACGILDKRKKGVSGAEKPLCKLSILCL